MTTDELQRIARDYRDLAARFRDAAGDERRTREAAAIAARLFHAARSDVPAFRELIEWRPDRMVSWSGTDARAEARWAGDWTGIVQALAVAHPDRLPPIMPGADYYATTCDLLADHAEDAYRAAMVERAQAGVADALARADVDTPTLPVDPHAGKGGSGQAEPTATDLASEVHISDDTFRRVRGAAGIVVTEKGAKARARRYPAPEVDQLIAAARDGNFIERASMMTKWAKWGTAASKPHASKQAAH